jgi:hypothetical protein
MAERNKLLGPISMTGEVIIVEYGTQIRVSGLSRRSAKRLRVSTLGP